MKDEEIDEVASSTFDNWLNSACSPEEDEQAQSQIKDRMEAFIEHSFNSIEMFKTLGHTENLKRTQAVLEGVLSAFDEYLNSPMRRADRIRLQEVYERANREMNFLFSKAMQEVNETVIYPNVETGIKINEANEASIAPRKKVQREAQGGYFLSERKSELEKRLKIIMDRIPSKNRACELLAEEKDVPWAAEYLRKRLLRK